jgi:2-hydroxychromene-2-carboxylate isomerase
MLEPQKNPNSKLLADPPGIVRVLVRHLVDRVVNPARLDARRDKIEAARVRARAPHTVEYFHQLDDPYSHLAAQVLDRFAARYDIKLVPHLIRPTGGKFQPEHAKLARYARRDVELVAPYLGLSFPSSAPVMPDAEMLRAGFGKLAGLEDRALIDALPGVGHAVWSGQSVGGAAAASEAQINARLDAGSARLAQLGHYSGATFYYGGEWYWGVDRLFHLERRLRDLGACKDRGLPFICPRPPIDVSGVDASRLTLDFFPSLNSPYTAIIYDRTISLARECGIQFNHRPILPMVMRGLPVPPNKGMYIVYDTKREAEHLNVRFGPVMAPVGKPVRNIYSLFPYARSLGRETDLLSAALFLAFAKGVGLHRPAGLRAAVERAGLSWAEAKKHLGSEDWKSGVEASQNEMVDVMDLWGVPSYRLRGGGAEDLCVWGQDRLWLVSAEIRKRAKSAA